MQFLLHVWRNNEEGAINCFEPPAALEYETISDFYSLSSYTYRLTIISIAISKGSAHGKWVEE